MIHLSRITWNAHNRSILHNISATLHPGECVLLIGPNGSGKSSLLDLISGKKQPHAGKIFHDNHDITAKPEHVRSQYIARLFQDPRHNIAPSLTVAENIAIARSKHHGIRLRNALHDKEHLIQQVERVGFTQSILQTPISHLSGGQRQLIAYAMATYAQPDVLMLDEPTAALDTHHATQLIQHVLRYQKTHNIATIIVTHDPEAVTHLGNRIWWLNEGSLSEWTHKDLERHNMCGSDMLGRVDYKQIIDTATHNN